MAALLRTIVHQSILTDVKVSTSSAAPPPIIRLARRAAFSSDTDCCWLMSAVRAFRHAPDPVVSEDPLPFPIPHRPQLSISVVNDVRPWSRSRARSPVCYGDRIFRIANAAADNRIDVYEELSVIGQILQLLIQHFETLQRHVIRLDIVDADLQVIQAGPFKATIRFGVTDSRL